MLEMTVCNFYGLLFVKAWMFRAVVYIRHQSKITIFCASILIQIKSCNYFHLFKDNGLKSLTQSLFVSIIFKRMVYMKKKRGLLVILSGPSGVGKGTVRDLFIEREDLNLAFSISMTTRAQREGEIDGQHYYFVSRDAFESAMANGELLEHAEFVGNYYGTPLAEVDRLRDLGKNVLLEIEVQGALQVIDRVPDALSIFLVPPSMDELRRRLEGRRTESVEILNERLNKAAKEMELMNQYRYVICNDDPEFAADMVSLIIKRNIEATQS